MEVSNRVCIFAKRKVLTMEDSLTYEAKLTLLSALNRINTQEELDELKSALSKFFMTRAENELDKLWEEGKINQATIEQWGNEHFRAKCII